ncbi:MAG TPA: hypothetical protein VIM53_00030 [Candidatus Saccharimonadales bacterium]
MRIVYPQFDLQTVIRYMEKNRDDILRQQSRLLTREQLRGVLGFSSRSGRAESIMSSLQQYGFVRRELKQAGRYSFTSSARNAIDANTPAAKRAETLAVAASAPELFSIFKHINGPLSATQLDGLSKKYGLSAEKLLDARNTFDKSQSFCRQIKLAEAVEPSVLPVHPASENNDIVVLAGAGSTILVDFGNGFTVQVPKRVIVAAAMDELRKIQVQLQG